IAHMIDELRAGCPESEVLISDGFFERHFYPYTFPSEAAPSCTTGAPRLQRPLVERIESTESGDAAQMLFDPASDGFLIDHKLRGRPWLPAVVGLEAVAEAASLRGDKCAVAIRDIELVEAFFFHKDRTTPA